MPEGSLRAAAISEKFASNVLDNLLEGCQIIGFDWTYLYLNDAVVSQAQRPREELLGRTMMECYPGIEGTPMFFSLRRCMTQRIHLRMENEFASPNGTLGWYELRFVPVPEGACILSFDISERKRTETALAQTEAQLRHAQKMEAVGRLAGGIAHDFNNLLSVISGYSDLILAGLNPSDPLHADVSEIRHASARAAILTRQLLAFSRRQVLNPKVIDLNRVVFGMESMIGRLLGGDVKLSLRLSRSLGATHADPGQIEQVLMNLVVNARDAMPKGGELTIQTQNMEVDEALAREFVALKPGPYVMVAVTDTGMGMDKATEARVFEPFFTTKTQDKGTGLGLATVFGIIKQSGGHVTIWSRPGKGTTVRFYLPRVEHDPARPAAGQDARLPHSEPPGPAAQCGNETLLLLDDDPQVRSVAANILMRSGYRVLEAANAGEALLICEQYAGVIDLLLCDLILPRMSGAELALRLCRDQPGIKVLYMSGGASRDSSHTEGQPEARCLLKPFTATELRSVVREVLDTSRPPGSAEPGA